MKVLSFGSLNIDQVYSVDHIIMPGETEPAGDVTENCGGKGLNQTIALAKAGVSVWHAGLVGKDGGILIDKCRENGVHTDLIRTTEGRSGHTVIQVDKNGQNSILLFGGANRCVTEEYIDEVLGHFEPGDMIVLQNEINLLDRVMDKAFERGMQIVLNPSPYDAALEKCDLGKVSFLLMNEIEGEQMTGEKDPDRILSMVKEKYPKARTVLTLGSEGAVYQDENGRHRQEIFKVKAIDTTAAGDTFTGYFIASLIRGMEPSECLETASKASAIAVTRPGALDSIPYREEVEQFR
ncbi:MAG: ribokinase [Lachnospiraceae bacterium]|nr:ribokinase [Lachnospiraceae bacterium]